jgi:DnaA family protein
MIAAEQLLLNVRPREDARLSDFDVPAYAEVLAAARQLLELPASLLYLYGEPENGHRYWLAGLCAEAEQKGLRAILLPLSELRDEDPALLLALEAQDLIVCDDIEAIAGHAAWQEALFHLFNRARATGCRLVFSAQYTPAQCGITLPDLVSRLASAPVWPLGLLDDESRLMLIKAAALRRGLIMEAEVARYLVLRGPRPVEQLLGLLERVDKRSLVIGRRVTVPFIRQVLEVT